MGCFSRTNWLMTDTNQNFWGRYWHENEPGIYGRCYLVTLLVFGGVWTRGGDISMRPHMAYIQHTLKRKQATENAANDQTSYLAYTKIAAQARMNGLDNNAILAELEWEKERIENDHREGDALFQQGLSNSKTSCIKAIDRIISEIKGEN